MAKIIKIFDYQFRKMRESIAKQREEMLLQNEMRMRETKEIIKQIRERQARFERSWFKLLKRGD